MRLRPVVSARPREALLAVAVGAALLGACGGGGGSKTTTTTTTTTMPKPVANIVIRPTQGPVGTAFTLIGTGFKPGETVTFQVVFPDPTHPPFIGQPHKTTPDGAVQTTYRATPGNPNGTYTVKATGDMGTDGQATFVVGPTTVTSTVPGTATTTRGASAVTTTSR
ncbi:MAG: hypothetical protein JO265_09240 [Acidimicrobiia bacterium]|nr:hypothetical protein [Acidimicrobiia bacterium]